MSSLINLIKIAFSYIEKSPKSSFLIFIHDVGENHKSDIVIGLKNPGLFWELSGSYLNSEQSSVGILLGNIGEHLSDI